MSNAKTTSSYQKILNPVCLLNVLLRIAGNVLCTAKTAALNATTTSNFQLPDNAYRSQAVLSIIVFNVLHIAVLNVGPVTLISKSLS